MKVENLEVKIHNLIPIVPGVKDILPRDQEFYTYIKKVVRHRCRQSGFRRMATPYFELAELFDTGLSGSEALLKKLYRFTDIAGRELALKLDGTIPVVRAYLGNKMTEWPQPVQLYYIEPAFFYQPNANHKINNFSYQFGAEVIGEADSALETQLIQLAQSVLHDLGIAHLYKLQINTLGCAKCREKYETDLKNFYYGKERSLCPVCRGELEMYPLHILSCPEEDCQILAELAPKIDKYLCKDCAQDIADMQAYLHELKIPFIYNHKFVRSANYYLGPIFEWLEINTSRPVSLGGGGRYDTLLERLGGESRPAVGFALSMDKMVEIMKKEKIRVPSKDVLQVFVAQLGHEAKKKCLVIMKELREAGIKTVGTVGKGSMREQLSLAQQFKVPYMVLMGLTEVREGKAIIRDMKVGSQRTVDLDEVAGELTKLIGEENLDRYSPGEVLY